MYRSPNIAKMIKSRRLRWAGDVARMEEGRSSPNIVGVTKSEDWQITLREWKKVGIQDFNRLA